MTGRVLIVLGTGGHAAVAIDLARSAGVSVKGCVGPDRPDFGADFCPHLGGDEVLAALDRNAIDLTIGVGSVGDARLRRELFERAKGLGFSFAPLAHPRAVVACSARLGEGVQVMAGALVQSFASIGRNAIINTGAIVEHHVKVGDHAHVAPGAVVCGGATIGEEAHIGANSTVLQGITVGAKCVIGAGAVVVRDAEAGSRVKGVPAA